MMRRLDDEPAIRKIIRFARKSPRQQYQVARRDLRSWIVPHLGNDRTTYIIGLFGTGRWYIINIIISNIGERGRYFKDHIRFHFRPTSMIYSGHATVKYESCGQTPPVVTSDIFKAIKSGFADSIFIYRHPLDSLLSNWVWWRTFIRENRYDGDITSIYKSTDDPCVDLDRNFVEFKAFAEGDPEFFAGAPNHLRFPCYHKKRQRHRFLSFSEFVEETELHLRSNSLALRLEDFMIDPLKGFSEITKLMSIDLDLTRLSIPPPRTKLYRYLAIKGEVAQFKNFIDNLNSETKRGIDSIGYLDV